MACQRKAFADCIPRVVALSLPTAILPFGGVQKGGREAAVQLFVLAYQAHDKGSMTVRLERGNSMGPSNSCV